MKKRLLAWLLTLTLVVGILPAVALAETTGEESAADTSTESSDSVVLDAMNGTVTIDKASYKLYLGQGIQTGDSLGWWLDSVNRGLIPDNTGSVNKFRYYLFLRGSNGAEASKKIYELFWTVCQMTDTAVTVNGQSDASGVTVGEISTFSDGYHKYIPVSVTGECGGTVSVTIKHVGEATYTLTKNFQYTQATELTLNADSNTYSISIDSANAGQSYFYYINLSEAQTVTVSGTLANAPVGRLVLAQTAEGTDESMLWWRWNSDSSANQATQTVTTDKILLRVVGNDGGTISGTVTVSDAQSGSNQPSGGESGQGDYAAYIGDYVVGFATKQSGGEVTVINESSNVIFGHGTKENTSQDVNYQPEAVISIAAATKRQDANNATIYDVDANVTNSLVINKLWLETVSGDSTTFSWRGDALVTDLIYPKGQSAQLYVKEGRNCRANIYAQITGSIGNDSFSTTVCSPVSLTITEFEGQVRPENDTVEDLNIFLKKLAEKINTIDQFGTLYEIKLGNTTYEGTIDVPSAFVHPHACLHFTGAAGNGKKTVIKGGMDINGANIERIENIHFVVDDSNRDKTKAIFGGGLRDVLNCSFYGYDIALDSSEGLINARGSVFVNNDIATLININDSLSYLSVLSGDWSNNTFINNHTAVQVLSLSKSISPYYFRIYDSNFINNGTDIDAQCGGTLYMYRNYFGRYKDVDGHRPTPGKYHADRHNGRDDLRLDELLVARTESKLLAILDYAYAKVNTDNSTKVVTNPRWLHPVKGWWNHNTLVSDTFFGTVSYTGTALMTLAEENEYEDILVSDWNTETAILNEESVNLILDASAFKSEGEKEIGVLDENENTMGTWTFE